MDEKRRTKISKFLSLILRHQPEAVGLHLEENGWAKVDDLIAAYAKNRRTCTRREFEEVVATNDKKRFSFDKSGKRIRDRIFGAGMYRILPLRFLPKKPLMTTTKFCELRLTW